MIRIIKKLLKLKRCYFCGKLRWHKNRIRIVESPKDYEGGGLLVLICKKCYNYYAEKGYR